MAGTRTGSIAIYSSAGGTVNVGLTGTGVSEIQTTTILSSTPNPSIYGAPVTLTATVSPSTAPGHVGFLSDGIPIADGTLSGGTVSVTVSSLTAGSHSLQACYPQNTPYLRSCSSIVTQAVNKASTSVSVNCSPNPITYGSQTSTCVAQTPAGTGTIATYWDGNSWCSGAAPGPISCTGWNGQPAGNHTFSASYSGDANYNSASNSTTLTINKATPTISLNCSPNPIVYNQDTTCTAHVSGGATGTVSLTANGGGWTTVTLNGSGDASATGWHGWSPGTYPVGATYNGDGNFNSVSTSTNITINKATPTVMATIDDSTITYGQSTLVHVHVSCNNACGQINFRLDGGDWGTVSLDGSGNATGVASNLSAGSHSIVAKYLGNTNYNAADSNTLSLTVNKATPTVSTWPTASAITYGQSLSSSTLSGGSASVGGSFAWMSPGTAPNAGTSSQSVRFNPTDTTNYNTVTGSVSVTVSRATPAVSAWPSASAITYGQSLSSSTLSGGSASVAGSFAWVSPGTTPNAGTSSQSVRFTPTDTTNYNTVTGSVSVTVSKATPTITWGNPAPVTYGTALSGTQLNATASVPGSFEYTPASGTVLGAGSQTLSVTFTPTDTANYTNANKSVTLTVNKATPTITWNTPAPILYGIALSETQLNATASVPGSFSYSPGEGTVLEAGERTLSVTFTPTDTTNYNPASRSVTLTVASSVDSCIIAAVRKHPHSRASLGNDL